MTKLLMPDELRAYFRECNARRPRSVKNCEQCGALMPPSYETRRYCSAACTKRAQRARQRQAVPQPATGEQARLHELQQLPTLTEQQQDELRRLERGAE
jgi:hypothetical protein